MIIPEGFDQVMEYLVEMTTLYIRKWNNGARDVHDEPTEGATAYVAEDEAHPVLRRLLMSEYAADPFAYEASRLAAHAFLARTRARLDADREAECARASLVAIAVIVESKKAVPVDINGQVKVILDRFDEQASIVDAMTGALLAVEWCPGDIGAECGECSRLETRGHDETCVVDAALKLAGFPDQASRDVERKRRAAPTPLDPKVAK